MMSTYVRDREERIDQEIERFIRGAVSAFGNRRKNKGHPTILGK